MTPKQYQQQSLHWLRRYYQKCRMMQEMGDSFPASTAFTAVTAELHEGQGLPYAPVKLRRNGGEGRGRGKRIPHLLHHPALLVIAPQPVQ